MIWAFLSARGFLGLAKGLWILIAIALVLGVVAWFKISEDADDRRNQELGATVEREKAATETINRVEKANEVEQTVRPGSRAAYDECVRSARTPANCIGLLPDREGD